VNEGLPSQPAVDQPGTEGIPTVHVVTFGADEERAAMEAWLADQQLAPQLDWASSTSASFRLNTTDANTVQERMRNGPDLEWLLVPPGQPDNLIRYLIVEGPDGRSFEVRDVPSVTQVGAVAQAVVQEYGEDRTESDWVVVDHVRPEGTPHRLNADGTLAQDAIGEGSRLRIGHQARAG
jgi:hypothetical protein